MGEFAGETDRDRSATDDVAELARVRVPTPVGAQVLDDDQVRGAALPLPAPSSMRTNASAACAARDSTACPAWRRVSSRSVSAVEPVHERDADTRWAARHGSGSCRGRLSSARTRAPRAAWAKSSSGSIASSRNLRAASLTAPKPDVHASASNSSSWSGTETISRACSSDTSPAATASLVAGAGIDGLHRAQRRPRRARARPARSRHPLRRVGEPTLAMLTTLRRPRRIPHPSRRARLLRAGEFLGDLRAHLTGMHAGLRTPPTPRETRPQAGELRARDTSPRPNNGTRKESHARQALEA